MPRRDRIVHAVLALTVAALGVRLFGLGARPFHWDEARVGYWTLRYLDTGTFAYRPVAGGPLLYLLDRWVFAVGPATDGTARLVVALVGGLLPLSALLLREALDDAETLLLAAVLGFAPPLVYYSRFLRGDVPLAAFGFLTVALLHRARVAGDRRALYAAGGTFGLALTTSGFAVAYPLCWAVAGLLSFDEYRTRGDPGAVAADRLRGMSEALRDWATPLARAGLLALAIVVLAYAPRGSVRLVEPATLLSAIEAALVGAPERFWAVRVLDRTLSHPGHGHPLVPFVSGHLGVLVATALPVVALALWGFLADRYSSDSRGIVAFAGYWAGLGLFVFPVATEVNAPWVVVHTLTPMAVPAAVGGGRFLRYARDAVDRAGVESGSGATRVAVVLLLLVAGGLHLGAVYADDVYGPADGGNDLAQFAQPADDLGGAMADARGAIAGHDGVDVLYVGEDRYVADESALARAPVPADARDAFGARLPLPWYFERMGARTASVQGVSGLPADPPPVVVAPASFESRLSKDLPRYDAHVVELGLTDRRTVIFVKG